MANVLVEEQYLSDIASAIRTQNGLSTLYKPAEMASKINDLKAREAWAITRGSFTSNIIGSTTYVYTDSTILRPGIFICDNYIGASIIDTYDLTNINHFRPSTIHSMRSTFEIIGTDFGGYFMDAKIKRLIFPSNMSSLSIQAYMFDNCAYLSSVEFGTGTKIATIGQFAFANCIKLSDINDWPYSTSFNIGSGAFYHCNELTNLSLNLNLGSASNGGGNIYECAFDYCQNLSVATVSCKNIGSRAFYRCSKLTSLSLYVTDQISSSAFYGCALSGEVLISGSYTNPVYAVFSNTNTTNTFWINAPNCSANITGCWGFSGCVGISVPNTMSVSWSNTYSLKWARFSNVISSVNMYGCPILESIYLPNLVYAGSFGGCYKLSDVYTPKYESLTSYAFYNCSALSSIDLPEALVIGKNAFDNCTLLSNISIPKAHTFSSSAFRSCYELSALSLPKASIFTPAVFYFCSKLISLYLMGSSVCKLSATAYNTFLGCPIYDSTVNNNVYGSIYVPSSLYATYIASTNWVTLSSRFVSM